MFFLKHTSLSAVTKRLLFVRGVAVVWCVFIPSLLSAQFITRGNAVKVSERCFKVTDDEHHQSGAVWWDRKIDLRQPLELNFVIYLGSRDADGADGIAFVLQNDPRGHDAKGTPGGGLGFAYHPSYTSTQTDLDVIKPSVAIEFDTYYNHDLVNEPLYDHTTVVYNGDLTRIVVPAQQINPADPNVEDGGCHAYKIKWDPATQLLELYFNGRLRFSHRDDLVNRVFNGNPIVHYGFTGSTGGSKNEQTICIYEAESKPVAVNDAAETEPGLPVTIPVLDNDSHSTGDAIGISAVVTQPVNGIVEVVGNSLVYTPVFGFVGMDSFEYEVCETGSDLCYAKCARATVSVTVVCRRFPPAPQAREGMRCGPGELVLEAEGGEAAAGSYRWYASASSPTPLAEGGTTTFTTPRLSSSTTYWVSFFDGACESERTPVTAHVQPLPAIFAGEDTKLYIGEELQLQGYGEGEVSWSPREGLSDPFVLDPVARPEKTTTYTLTVTDARGCTASDDITITLVDGIFVPNAFSPNGDGLNDSWEILKISRYPGSTVTVFDRWGKVVFESRGYTLPWDGSFKGKRLPLGSYAYVIELGEGRKPLKGIVSIVH